MNEAWALLKGNPSMRDARGKAINHPAAMVYDDLAHQFYLANRGRVKYGAKPAQEDEDRLRQMREEAREQTRDRMDFGNEDDSPSPNYGIQRTPQPEP